MTDVFPDLPTAILFLLLAFGKRLEVPDLLLRATAGCLALVLVWSFFHPVHINLPQPVGFPLKIVLCLLIIGGAISLVVGGAAKETGVVEP